MKRLLAMLGLVSGVSAYAAPVLKVGFVSKPDAGYGIHINENGSNVCLGFTCPDREKDQSLTFLDVYRMGTITVAPAQGNNTFWAFPLDLIKHDDTAIALFRKIDIGFAINSKRIQL